MSDVRFYCATCRRPLANTAEVNSAGPDDPAVCYASGARPCLLFVIAARDRELQQAAAENAAMWEALSKPRRDHDCVCASHRTIEIPTINIPDGAIGKHIIKRKCDCGADEYNAAIDCALATPSPRAAQILAALDAARLAYAVPNQTATGADLEALTDLGRKLAALVSHE